AGLIGSGRILLDDGLGARLAPPDSVLLLPFGNDDHLLPGGELHSEAGIGIKNEGGAIENELVLTADLVQVSEWQPALGDPRDRDIKAKVRLQPVEGRAVGRDDDLRAGFLQALDDVLLPDVLTNRHADTHAAHVHRSG